MNRIKELRKKKGLTLNELSENTNIPAMTLSRYERGVRKLKNDVVINLANYFDVSVEYLKGAWDKPSIYKLMQDVYLECTDKKYQDTREFQLAYAIEQNLVFIDDVNNNDFMKEHYKLLQDSSKNFEMPSSFKGNTGIKFMMPAKSKRKIGRFAEKAQNVDFFESNFHIIFLLPYISSLLTEPSGRNTVLDYLTSAVNQAHCMNRIACDDLLITKSFKELDKAKQQLQELKDKDN